MPIYNFKSITEFHEHFGLSEPENPLFSINHSKLGKDEELSCDEVETNEAISINQQFYAISLKNIIAGELVYGRTKYDCSKGTLLFTAPNQTIVFKGLVYSSESYHLAFHKDYLNGSPLFEKIKKYHFFNYHVNEALHLSPKEEKVIKAIFKNIETEYHNNQDEFSKELILSHLDTFFKYADRFYKRQFLHRKELNQQLFTRFKTILNEYYANNFLQEKGIPKVDWLASKLGVSHRYMSDTIKAETGKTAIDQVNLFLIEQAKNLLLNPDKSISEIAYQLGFEYPQYFTRILKKKVGMSPKVYINKHSIN